MTGVTTLATINLVLDILVKVVFLALFIFGILVLRQLEDVIQSAERSAESIENTAETVESLISIANFLPFVGPKRNNLKVDEEDKDE